MESYRENENSDKRDKTKPFIMRLPKGTKDYVGKEYHKMSYLKSIVENIFKLHQGEYLETPTFELTDILTNKYGEDEKLIYNLECSESEKMEKSENSAKSSMFKEKLSLRYDLTVPLVRHCILNNVAKMRRCSIGKVYRRETTSANSKRLREFYQADFDFVGEFGEFLPEVSIFSMICTLFDKLNYDSYEIIYNYREILNECVEKAGRIVTYPVNASIRIINTRA